MLSKHDSSAQIFFHDGVDIFNLTLESNSTPIYKGHYRLNSKYKVKTINFKPCITKDLFTSVWICTRTRNASSSQVISVDDVCNNVPQCNDLSDEDEFRCKGAVNDLTLYFGGSFLIFWMLGILGVLLLQLLKHGDADNNIECDNSGQGELFESAQYILCLLNSLTKKQAGAKSSIRSRSEQKQQKKKEFCKQKNAINIKMRNSLMGVMDQMERLKEADLKKKNKSVSKKEGVTMSKEILDILKNVYRPCDFSKQNKVCFQVIHALSLYRPYKRICERLIDELFEFEKSVHGCDGKALECLLFCKDADSYISSWINDVYERNGVFSSIKKKLMCLITAVHHIMCFKNESLIHYSTQGINLAISIAKVISFYRDVVVDIILISILYHIDDKILKHIMSGSEDDRYDSVAGINLKLTSFYLGFVLLFSEIWIYFHIFKRRKNLAKIFLIKTHKTLSTTIVSMFPIHASVLEQFKIQYKLLEIDREINHQLGIKCSSGPTTDAITMVENWAQRIDELNKQLHAVNQLYSEIQIIESAGERELQLVIQTILFVYAQYFPRLLTLFDDVFGIPVYTVFVVNWIIGLMTITNSVINYRSSKRFPFAPGLLGKILIFLTVFILVFGKVVFVTASLGNFPYLHPVAHGLKIVLTYLYSRWIFNHKGEKNFETVIAASIVGAFFTVPKKDFLNKNNKYKEFFSKFGGLISVVILECMSYILYGAFGITLRSLSLPKDINVNIIGDFALTHKTYFEEIFLKFDYKFVLVWPGMIITLYMIFVTAYYYKGHPKKIIINEKNKHNELGNDKKTFLNTTDCVIKTEQGMALQEYGTKAQTIDDEESTSEKTAAYILNNILEQVVLRKIIDNDTLLIDMLGSTIEDSAHKEHARMAGEPVFFDDITKENK